MKTLHVVTLALVLGSVGSFGLFVLQGRLAEEPGGLIAARLPEAREPPPGAGAGEPGVQNEKQENPGETMSVSEQSKRVISRSAYDITPLSKERVAELASKLDEETYRITQRAGTEPPFCGMLLDNKKEGVYCCVVCGLPLFSSEHKFTSGTGWPSFYREFDRQHVSRKADRSHGMVRTEINCARCGAHLGHVFDDGPKPTGERHCLNSASLVFYEKGKDLPAESRPIKTETAYFAGGCFWGIEHYFQKGPGVIDAVSGYMQGRTEKPTYKEVCTKDTGHAETVKVVFDPTQISYRRLLEAFFVMHDPTQWNRQGPDVGSQYRSGIWYTSEEQRAAAEEFIRQLQDSGKVKGRIVTQLEKAETFWEAEEYHQDYIANTGRACHVKNPW
ncbi:MAG: bifunctional methionine sulfoxide reductase B/A protein [Phycisphaerales bacterium]|nr:bifunctional methionine sulfoxide reductase B/A protein [Phycisphaerales bacterium]